MLFHASQSTLEIQTKGRGFIDVTRQVAEAVEASGVVLGTCALFLQHTSASLVIQENADPAVLRDLEQWMSERVPEGAGYEHDEEGPDDMPAHIRGAITRTSEVVPVRGGKLTLGTWQAVYVWEHRRAPHTRRLTLTLMGTQKEP